MLDFIYTIFRAIASVVGLEQVVVDAWEAVLDFFEMGGPIIPVVALVLVIMWIFMLERLFYFYFEHNKVVAEAMKVWEARSERKSWHAHRVREFLISEVRVKTTEFLGLIKVAVALCPLVGLLGTVTGMITVFEVMALLGSGNARAMAAGVTQATIPTMSGLVAALSGYFISVWLQSKAKYEIEAMSEHMTMDH
ncbi:MAG: MotA/TolQ/ExbB proton channel family protein [Gammaproteobacteria bacterium]|jgi:biopolymer transport protein ExbB|nr:MotA/TolQ/ExbB proton channel family protein [Gammaproteobacteria bacterium]